MSIGSTTPDSGALRFSRQVVWTMAARLLTVASSILAGAIVARWLGPSGLGVIAALAVVTLLAINVGGLGLPSSLTFLVARDKRNTKPAFLNAIVFGFVAGSLLAAVIILTATARPGLLGEIPTNLLAVAMLALPVQMLVYLCLAIYLGLERIRRYNLIDLSLQGIILVNAVVTLVVLGYGLSELVAVGAAANIAAGLVITVMLARDIRDTDGPWTFDAALMREMFRYGLRFFVAMTAGLVILRGDLLIVNYFRGSGEAGVYAVATQVTMFLHMMPNVISTLLFPRTSGARDESGKMTCRVTRHAVFVMLILCFLAIPAAFVLARVYGPGFSEVPVQFLILLPGVFLLGIETIQVQHFTGLGLPRVIPAFWIGVMLLNLTLNFILVPRYGAYGAALASSLAYGAIFVLVAGYFRRKTRTSLTEAFILGMPELRALLNTQRDFLHPRSTEAE
jgi:O-antigen/teichoic acid export membrane protein